MTNVQYSTFAIAKNKIWIRLSNLEDKFDQPKPQTKFLNLNKLALSLYQQANLETSSQYPSIQISELSLSGNQKFSENEEFRSTNRWVADEDLLSPSKYFTLQKD